MRVRALALTFIDNGLRRPGDEFEYNGPENHHLESLEVSEEEVSKPAPKPASPPRKRVRNRKKAAPVAAVDPVE